MSLSYFWLTERQFARLETYFPASRGQGQMIARTSSATRE
jgi:hypothetical protein